MKKIEAPNWRKSSRCGSNACVEVAKVEDAYLIRDSKDPNGPVLRLTAAEWAEFLKAVKTGEFRP
jgi:hypothetical protein